MNILFEDNHLLILNKPAGLVTQESEGHADSLEEMAKRYIKEAYNKPGNVFLHAVHRLDKDVSGIVLFAKTSKALSRLQEAMRSQLFKKVYVALVEGKLTPSTGTLEHMLVHGDRQAYVANEGEKEAKKCLLSYELLHFKQEKSLVRIHLHTGRYHQIRAQFAAIGHPVCGDTTKYGSKKAFHEKAIALHHLQLELIHPIGQQKLSFIAPLPSFWPALEVS